MPRAKTFDHPVIVNFTMEEAHRARMRKAMHELGDRTEAEFLRAAVDARIEIARQHWKDRVATETKAQEAERVTAQRLVQQTPAQLALRGGPVPSLDVRREFDARPVDEQMVRDAGGLTAAERTSLTALEADERAFDAAQADHERSVLAGLGLPWVDPDGNYTPEATEQTPVSPPTEQPEQQP